MSWERRDQSESFSECQLATVGEAGIGRWASFDALLLPPASSPVVVKRATYAVVALFGFGSWNGARNVSFPGDVHHP